MSGVRWIKTKRETIYRRLVRNMEDPQYESLDYEVYPFEFGYELFSAGLVAGYLEREPYEGEYDGDGDYHQIVRFGQFAENNPQHVACIDLFERLIIVENNADSDGEESENSDGLEEEKTDEITWDDIVAYADKGVGFLNGEWNEDHQFDIDQYFSTTEFEVQNRIDELRDELRRPPTAGDEGNLTL